MSSQPAGTVTLLFSDIEGSTDLLLTHRGDSESILMRHFELLGRAIDANRGHTVDTSGDGIFAAFETVHDALLAAVESQRSLASEPWVGGAGVRVRIGLHTGVPTAVSHGYVGIDVHKAARIMSAAHGGQILVSRTTAALLHDELLPGVSLRDLGPHRLKDLSRPETLFQVEAPGLGSDFAPLRTLDSRTNNLPPQSTPLVGRTRELAEADRLMSSTRLLTLTGPGGSGKTRLGLQIAADSLEQFEDGVFFVSLAAVTDPQNVPDAIVRVLSPRVRAGEEVIDSLQRHLREMKVLLVLDNFEQVVGAAPVVARLLEKCPGLKVLVTSREPLRLSGEQEYPVPPLDLPELKRIDVNALSTCDATQLFVQRARAVNPGFAVSDQNARAVAEICIRLDGLPLSIELAAARMKLFSPATLRERLGSQLRLLSGDRQDLPDRQRTLRNTIDWSYNLLDEVEKELFGQLGVFDGGFTLEAAETVCTSPADPANVPGVMEGVESLLNKSLLRRTDETNGESRFWMLETIREYAVERLDSSPNADRLRNAHAAFYADLSERFEKAMWSEERALQVTWIKTIDVELENIRAAFDWSSNGGNVSDAFRLVGNLRVYFGDQGRLAEIFRLADRLAGRSSGIAPIYRSRVHSANGIASSNLGDDIRAEAEFTSAARLAEEAGHEREAALATHRIFVCALRDPRRYVELERRMTDVIAAGGKTGDYWMLLLAHNFLGELYRIQGRYEDAHLQYEEAIAHDLSGSNHIGLLNIGFCEWRLDRPREAEKRFRQVLVEERAGTSSPGSISYALLGMAAVAPTPERALCLLVSSDTLLDPDHRVRDHADQLDFDVIMDRVKKSVDAERFSAISDASMRLPLDEAVAYALGERELPWVTSGR